MLTIRDRDSEFVRNLSKVNRESLAPGPYLDYQNVRANDSLNELIDKKLDARSSGGCVTIDLHYWIKYIITIAATDGVFGTANPYLDEKNRDAFW